MAACVECEGQLPCCLHKIPERRLKVYTIGISVHYFACFSTIICDMGRKPWPTKPQMKWLKNLIPQYRESQRQKKHTEFFESTISAFFQDFTLELAGSGVARANDDLKKLGMVVEAPDLKTARTVRLLSYH